MRRIRDINSDEEEDLKSNFVDKTTTLFQEGDIWFQKTTNKTFICTNAVDVTWEIQVNEVHKHNFLALLHFKFKPRSEIILFLKHDDEILILVRHCWGHQQFKGQLKQNIQITNFIGKTLNIMDILATHDNYKIISPDSPVRLQFANLLVVS